MSNEILINATPNETRVAIVEKGMVQELYLERRSQQTYVGNIYKGKVIRILPGMQAAFVDIGLERTAFLHANEIGYSQINLSDAANAHPGNTQPENTPTDTISSESGASDHTESEPPSISNLLHLGQLVDVQVIKDPIGSKGARLSMQISIPSRYLVLLPNTQTIGVSVRIEDGHERERLRQIIQELRQTTPKNGNGEVVKIEPQNNGYIVRTNAEGVSADELQRDMHYLQRLWAILQYRMQRGDMGSCIYEELSLAQRSMRDYMNQKIEQVRIDSAETFEQVREFVDKYMPAWSSRLQQYQDDRPIFDLFGVDDEIENALGKTTALKSGGYLVIDQTEAMTTVDVNTGGYVGFRNMEETIFKTNLEAAQAIARQLRLRNLGGMIIIDFIDMQDANHQEQVLRTLEKAVQDDHARVAVHPFSELGLVQMTRKRVTESLSHRLCESCPTCSGRGEIKSTETVCFEIFREIMRSVRQFDAAELLVLAAPNVVEKIHDDYATVIAEMEEGIGKNILLKAEDQYSQEQFDVVLI